MLSKDPSATRDPPREACSAPGCDANVFAQVLPLKALVAQATQVLRHTQDCESLNFEIHRFDMSNLIGIQEAIEKLAPKERAELWDWFQAQEVEETDEMLESNLFAKRDQRFGRDCSFRRSR
jgi:hypothetical protein